MSAARAPRLPTFGVPIPSGAKALALQHLTDMVPDLPFASAAVLVDQVAVLCEADEPDAAMALARCTVDLAGAYRLLAALHAHQAAAPPAAPRGNHPGLEGLETAVSDRVEARGGNDPRVHSHDGWEGFTHAHPSGSLPHRHPGGYRPPRGQL